MSLTRPFIISALCAFALPVAAFGDVPTSTGTTPTGAACSCDNVCAQRDQAAAQARAEAHRRAALRARRNHNGAVASRGMTTMHIDTRINRPVAEGCTYTAQAEGTYRSPDPTGVRGETVALRDLDVQANASLSCNGQVVRHTSQRWVFPTTNEHQIQDLMHQRLALQVPGSSCEWASSYRFEGGNLATQGVGGNCSHDDSTAALSGYNIRTTPVTHTNAIGGGPRSNAREIKRFSHDGNMFEGVGTFDNGSRTGGQEPSANDARLNVR